jgi:hypothetical protein
VRHVIDERDRGLGNGVETVDDAVLKVVEAGDGALAVRRRRRRRGRRGRRRRVDGERVVLGRDLRVLVVVVSEEPTVDAVERVVDTHDLADGVVLDDGIEQALERRLERREFRAEVDNERVARDLLDGFDVTLALEVAGVDRDRREVREVGRLARVREHLVKDLLRGSVDAQHALDDVGVLDGADRRDGDLRDRIQALRDPGLRETVNALLRLLRNAK